MYLVLFLVMIFGYFMMYLVPCSFCPWFIDFYGMKKDIIRFLNWLCEPIQ